MVVFFNGILSTVPPEIPPSDTTISIFSLFMKQSNHYDRHAAIVVGRCNVNCLHCTSTAYGYLV